MFSLYTAVTCSLKLNISKCDQFLKWQKPIKLFKNIDGVEQRGPGGVLCFSRPEAVLALACGEIVGGRQG